jgi:hypothetical protein
MNQKRLFKEMIIYKPISEKSVIRYRCFEILSEGKYFVAQADNFQNNFTETEWKQFDNYFFGSVDSENFDEMTNEACRTIEEAIAKHEADFAEMYDEFDELKK